MRHLWVFEFAFIWCLCCCIGIFTTLRKFGGKHHHRKRSSKALIDTGFLVNAITQKIMADKTFVGLLRGTVNAQGEDMVNISAVMEYGATIHHPSGATITIPARPFLHPVMEQYRKEIIENYRHALRDIGL